MREMVLNKIVIKEMGQNKIWKTEVVHNKMLVSETVLNIMVMKKMQKSGDIRDGARYSGDKKKNGKKRVIRAMM